MSLAKPIEWTIDLAKLADHVYDGKEILDYFEAVGIQKDSLAANEAFHALTIVFGNVDDDHELRLIYKAADTMIRQGYLKPDYLRHYHDNGDAGKRIISFLAKSIQKDLRYATDLACTMVEHDFNLEMQVSTNLHIPYNALDVIVSEAHKFTRFQHRLGSLERIAYCIMKKHPDAIPLQRDSFSTFEKIHRKYIAATACKENAGPDMAVRKVKL